MIGRSLFDLLAPIYDRVVRPPDLGPLSRLADLPCRGRLLDAGGGTGRIAEGLAGMVASAIVADESLPMLARGRSKGSLGLVAARAEWLPFASETFARVVMVDAFHHLGDPEASLAELWRVLEPGGRLVIEEPDVRRFAVRLVALLERLALMRSRFVVAEQIAAWITRLGARARVARLDHTAWVIAEKDSAVP
jgi:demethylmenaquinone methyltransferase/2-methoxy-6-polyprenyl-1,4-benzoquinol methylase